MIKLEDLTYEQCVRQGVGPLVFAERLRKPLSGSPLKGGEDAQLRAEMKAVCVRNIQRQAQLQRVLEQAWSVLTAAGIRPVLMKGAGLAALYPGPEMREWSDVDLYVGPEQYHPACAAMRAAFPEAKRFEQEQDYYKHYNLIIDGVSVEIHRKTVELMHPVDAIRYAKWERLGMCNTERIMCNGLELQVPETTFNVLMVLMHSWEHVISKSANLRQIYDLALLVTHKREEIDRERLKRYLKALHMEEVWEVYMYVAKEMFSVESEELREKSEEIRERGERLVEEMIGEKSEEIRERGERLVEEMIGEKSEERGRGLEGERVRGLGDENRFIRKFHTMKERMKNAKRIERYSPEYAQHMRVAIMLRGMVRLFAPNRHWE